MSEKKVGISRRHVLIGSLGLLLTSASILEEATVGITPSLVDYFADKVKLQDEISSLTFFYQQTYGISFTSDIKLLPVSSTLRMRELSLQSAALAVATAVSETGKYPPSFVREYLQCKGGMFVVTELSSMTDQSMFYDVPKDQWIDLAGIYQRGADRMIFAHRDFMRNPGGAFFRNYERTDFAKTLHHEFAHNWIYETHPFDSAEWSSYNPPEFVYFEERRVKPPIDSAKILVDGFADVRGMEYMEHDQVFMVENIMSGSSELHSRMESDPVLRLKYIYTTSTLKRLSKGLMDEHYFENLRRGHVDTSYWIAQPRRIS